MRSWIIIGFLSFFTFSAYSQTTEIVGIIFDRHSEEPIPFVNIALHSFLLGTVSDSSGQFTLNIQNTSHYDSIEVSKLGFKPKKVSIQSFLTNEESGVTAIFMDQQALEMNEFVVTAKPGTKLRQIGRLKSKSRFGFAFNPMKTNASENLGREAGIKVDSENFPFSLLQVKFYLANNQLDHVVFRLNIYRESLEEKGLPGEKVHEKLFDVINKEKGEITVKPKDLQFSETIWVTIEFVGFNNDQKAGVLTMPVAFPFGKTITRQNSLGEWAIISGAPSIMVEIEG